MFRIYNLVVSLSLLVPCVVNTSEASAIADTPPLNARLAILREHKSEHNIIKRFESWHVQDVEAIRNRLHTPANTALLIKYSDAMQAAFTQDSLCQFYEISFVGWRI